MSDKIKEFIKDNKKKFEVKSPSENLWARIEAELNQKKQPKKSFKLYLWMRIAAVFLVSLGLYFGYNYEQSQDIVVADINKEYGLKESRFVNEIQEKKDSLVYYAAKNPVLYEKFTADLTNLDEEYERLKVELPKSLNQTLVVKAMVKNREMQLRVLNQQLLIINQVNQYKENSI